MLPRPAALPFLVLSLLASPLLHAAEPAPADPPAGAWATVRADYARFYSTRRLIRIGAGFAAGGLVANSDADEEAREGYLEDVFGAGSDGFSDAVETLGEGEVVMPLFVAAAFAVGLAPEGPAPSGGATWLRRAGRAYLVGAPALYYLQQLTGGSRPGEPEGSGWDPFHGNHGVSGHAFVGAVPFLTLARQSRRAPARALAVAASTLPALQRLREDEHFLSQVALGWLLAWEATGAVAQADRSPARPAVAPLAARDGGGLLLVWRF
ncbi:MAG TPA: phosphatase PAP2 family protein [Thermoanaerobaculia bacterium]|nr:phosphatase PAP2 family protein [Thermoanaerobaculia bacterium]